MVDFRNPTRIILFLLLLGILFLCRVRIGQYEAGLTLKEAISLAAVEAHHWSRDASLVYAVSIDADDISSTGRNGEKTSWNLVFLNERSQHDLLVAIRNGRVSYMQEVLMVYRNRIVPKKMKLDSETAIKIIKQLGTIKNPTAYNYELFCLKRTYLKVYCRGDDGRCSVITFDVNTGQLCR